MNKRAEAYSQILEEMFGEPDSVREVKTTDGGDPVCVYFYHNFPQDGTITALTYGLSESKNPAGSHYNPEIIITLDTEKEDWGLAVGSIVAELRGKRKFSEGDLFILDKPISDESDMIGFFVYTPSLLDEEQSVVEIDTTAIQLVGMYPIYPEEVDMYNSIGLDEFWFHEEFDLYDPKRKNLGKE